MTVPDEPTTYGVQIDAQPGEAAIRIDGELLPAGQVTGYVLEHDVHASIPTLVLHTRQPNGIHWAGLARVAVAAPEQNFGELIADFLGQIDPAALERAALDRDDLDGGRHGVTKAILQQLTEWAHGKGND